MSYPYTTSKILSDLESKHYIILSPKSDASLSGIVEYNRFVWSDNTFSYGIYDTINGVRKSGVIAIPYVPVVDDVRLYGSIHIENVESRIELSEKNLGCIFIYDDKNEYIKAKLRQ